MLNPALMRLKKKLESLREKGLKKEISAVLDTDHIKALQSL